MGVITVKLSDRVEKLLREAAFRKYGGVKGSLSKIIEEALLEWLSKRKESARVYRVIFEGKVLIESRSLDEISSFLRERNIDVRRVRIITIPVKSEYRVGPRL